MVVAKRVKNETRLRRWAITGCLREALNILGIEGGEEEEEDGLGQECGIRFGELHLCWTEELRSHRYAVYLVNHKRWNEAEHFVGGSITNPARLAAVLDRESLWEEMKGAK